MMGLCPKRKIEVSEPVQWAVDFLEEMIGFYWEEEIEVSYWEKLLQEKKREIMEDFCALAPSFSSVHQGMGFCAGLNGGRVLVMKILMGILPPYRSPRSCRKQFKSGAPARLQTFQEVLTYLKALHLTWEDDSLLWKEAFFAALARLLHHNFSPYLFYRGSWPAFVLAPPYREKTAACYLPNPQLIVLYSLPEENPAKRLHLILHEIGHLVFEKFLANRPLPSSFVTLLHHLELKDYPNLFCPSTQGIGEIFANLFSIALLYETPEGDQIFHDYYSKMGEAAPLLAKAFLPDSLLFQTAAGS
jgi:hypothetical protein